EVLWKQPQAAPLALSGPPLSFHRAARHVPDLETLDKLLKADPSLANRRDELLLQEAVEPGPASSVTQGGEFQQAIRDWSYNHFVLDVTTPDEGWVFIRQVHDPLWRVKLDGQPVRLTRANFAGVALRMGPGKHVVEMDYRPLGRWLYWPACVLLE